jgi:hypothetical protein
VKGSRLSLVVVGVLLLAFAGAGLASPVGQDADARAKPKAKPKRKPKPKPVRTQLLAHVNPGGPAYNGDVVAQGTHAYLGSWRAARGCPATGVRVFDIANPRQPRRVATFADAASEPQLAGTWTEKTIVRHVGTASFTGDVAVTSIQACAGASFQGFGLYDVTNPETPKRLALVRLDPRGSHEIWLAAARGHAWVYTAIPQSELLGAPDYDPRTGQASSPGPPDFRIYDVSDPHKPVQVGSWGAWRDLGIRPNAGRGDYIRANFVHSVMTNGQATLAFLSYWDLGTVILDINDPSAPRYLGRTNSAADGEGDAHSAWLAKGEKVLVETHEDGYGRPYFYDISTPSRPRLLSRFGPVTNDSPSLIKNGVHDPKVLGNRAFFSWYSRGVLIANIANPRKPRLLTKFVPKKTADPLGSFCPNGTRCTMTWGVFPTKNYVLAADMVSGLWIFRIR